MPSIKPIYRLIILHAANGLNEKETASELGLTVKGLKYHKTNLYKALGAKNMAHALNKLAESYGFYIGTMLDLNPETQIAVKQSNLRKELKNNGI